MEITVSDAAANAILTELLGRLDAGAGPVKAKLYTGTKPTKPDVAITTQVLLGTATCSATAGVVADRALTFNAITQDDEADADGTATWCRFTTSDDTPVVDVDVGTTTSSAFMKMNTTSVKAGGPFRIASCVITL